MLFEKIARTNLDAWCERQKVKGHGEEEAKCTLSVTHLATALQTLRSVWLTPWTAGFVFFWPACAPVKQDRPQKLMYQSGPVALFKENGVQNTKTSAVQDKWIFFSEITCLGKNSQMLGTIVGVICLVKTNINLYVNKGTMWFSHCKVVSQGLWRGPYQVNYFLKFSVCSSQTSALTFT